MVNRVEELARGFLGDRSGRVFDIRCSILGDCGRDSGMKLLRWGTGVGILLVAGGRWL